MAIIPLYNVIAVPDSNMYLKTDTYREKTGRSPAEGEKVTIIIQREDTPRSELTGESFYPIGVSGTVDEVNTSGYMALRLGGRVNIDDVIIYSDNNISLSLSTRHQIDDLDHTAAQARLNRIKQDIVEFANDYPWGGAVRAYARGWQTVGEVAAAMSPWLTATNEERYRLLAEDSLTRRTDMIEQLLYENLESLRVQARAQNAQQEDYQKLYRESAIRKQIEYLQKELDEMHPENVSDVRRMEIKLEESGMNETALKEGRKVLARLKNENHQSPESGMLTDYLDFLTSLPWKKADAEPIDLNNARRVLEEDHFGLDKVKRRVIEQIAVLNLKGRQSGSILLFVGAPGTGKTSIGQSIARALGRKYARVSLGGVRDEADIRGHRRTYIGAMPGRILDGIHKCGASNPVMVLDEVDKLSQSYNGDPASALLEVLDPEQNSTFTDHYLNVPYDLSDVLFICTANTLDTIPEPLLNRMEVIQFQGYTPLDKQEIARRHLLPRALEATGLDAQRVTVDDAAIRSVIDEYTREAGVRGLKKRMDTICRSAAVRLVESPDEQIHVTAENLGDYIDANPIHHKNVRQTAKPGIVTGLAWTSVGGDILYIETMFTRGSGKLIITGQLGDVMKESAQIAISLVKAAYPDKAELFDGNDLHIHVPDGATPKDGPSAGITLTTALASLVNGYALSPEIAMTGEVSLQGDVNPIGGLPEKLMAAHRSGVRRVFIPADNVDDLKDVAQEVRQQLEITPVSTVEQVFELTGIPAAEQRLHAV